ncbi:hypothetical protein BDBG_16535 [Blastomyces gilchristii SLH14081]|uniref:Uncharacterized protein n=1 Tax=Blastomyces gilchristii (strain SLH14081) TaxID=559298 RepID=A0A179UDA5_BLAGS|nr:uncharacterized protein BDBG_16535 [Blastomyces gilchristii SLH14081]OAT05986.1 hypothetical protein BDBG_16535 [Blastomyces gilchristii SLH14081]
MTCQPKKKKKKKKKNSNINTRTEHIGVLPHHRHHQEEVWSQHVLDRRRIKPPSRPRTIARNG